jgi:hypothetical protein
MKLIHFIYAALIAAILAMLVFIHEPTLPCPAGKLGAGDPHATYLQPIENGLRTRSLAYEDMAISLRDSLTTGHTVDGVGASPDGTVCTGAVIPYLACRQSIEAPTIPEVKPMRTISFDDDLHGVVTELEPLGGAR